jgi:hypothetical protein
MKRALLLLAVLGLAALVPAVQGRVDALRTDGSAQEEILYLSRGRDLKRLAPGFEDVMADVYWLRTVQYYGGQRAFATHRRYDLLEPLIEITTTLDPHFTIAYRYGATFLSEGYPAGPGQPERGVALLEKGVQNNPQDWILWQNLGFFTYLYAGDYKRGARYLLEGARQPGAPAWLTMLAADLERKGGDRETARQIWQHLSESVEAGALKENAQRHILALDAADAVDRLNALVARFRGSHARNPHGWEELRDIGLLTGRPADPAGVPLDYDAALGEFFVSVASPLAGPEEFQREATRKAAAATPSSESAPPQATERGR